MLHHTFEDMMQTKALASRKLFLSGFEPETFCVLSKRDNHYTTETVYATAAPFKITKCVKRAMSYLAVDNAKAAARWRSG